MLETYIWDAQLELTDPEPFIASFASTRDMYQPLPTDSQWEQALAYVREEIEKEIRSKGVFTDQVRRGFFIATPDRYDDIILSPN